MIQLEDFHAFSQKNIVACVYSALPRDVTFLEMYDVINTKPVGASSQNFGFLLVVPPHRQLPSFIKFGP